MMRLEPCNKQKPNMSPIIRAWSSAKITFLDAEEDGTGQTYMLRARKKKKYGKEGAECAEDSRGEGDRENLGRRQLQGGVLDQRDIIHGRTLLAHLKKDG